jgi:hypothetical protein
MDSTRVAPPPRARGDGPRADGHLRMAWKIRWLVVVSLVALAGCGKNEAVEAAEDMADAVCKCKDIACAQQASEEGSAKLMKLAESTRGTEDDAKKILAASERAGNCIQKLASAE